MVLHSSVIEILPMRPPNFESLQTGMLVAQTLWRGELVDLHGHLRFGLVERGG